MSLFDVPMDDISPEERHGLRNVPPMQIILRWAHYRPARDELGNVVESGPPVNEGVKELDLVPNSGLSWISSQMAGVASGLSAVIALGTGTSTPTMGDTVLGGEITGNGLTRTTGTTSGIGALVNMASGGDTSQSTGSFAVGNTFTSSGSVTVNEAGLEQSVTFNAGLVAHDLVSPAATMAAGDTLRVQYEVVL